MWHQAGDQKKVDRYELALYSRLNVTFSKIVGDCHFFLENNVQENVNDQA